MHHHDYNTIILARIGPIIEPYQAALSPLLACRLTYNFVEVATFIY
jgi:hypothetical protein